MTLERPAEHPDLPIGGFSNVEVLVPTLQPFGEVLNRFLRFGNRMVNARLAQTA